MSEKKIKTVGIVVKPEHKEALETAHELSVWLGQRKISAKQKDFERSELAKDADIERNQYEKDEDLGRQALQNEHQHALASEKEETKEKV
mgnify:CR=1 FL=1